MGKYYNHFDSSILTSDMILNRCIDIASAMYIDICIADPYSLRVLLMRARVCMYMCA